MAKNKFGMFIAISLIFLFGTILFLNLKKNPVSRIFQEKKTTLNLNANSQETKFPENYPESEENEDGSLSEKIILKDPEISGWIAWWIEKAGREVVEKRASKIHSVSPGWLKLDKSGRLVEIGKQNKEEFSQKCRENSIKLYPMLVTDMNDRELAIFIKNEKKLKDFVQETIDKLKSYEAQGMDLDFENIGENYISEFSQLIQILSGELQKNDLRFSATIQAQTGKNDWVGLKGQDISLIGKYADEVRIMIYDRHGDFSGPGPITPTDWFLDVLKLNLELVPREKIVVALPTYGYIWFNDGSFRSFQYKDFVSYAKDKKYNVSRDPDSSELKYQNKNSTGFLSDSEAVVEKMKLARLEGINRFAFWNFSGTDENLFEEKWEDLEVSIPRQDPSR